MGNASLLCERSDLWNEIVSNLEDHARNRIGSRLPLRCQRHGELTEVQWPVDFATIPEGGCTRPCGERLPCGHVVSDNDENHHDGSSDDMFFSVSYHVIPMIMKKYGVDNLAQRFLMDVAISVQDVVVKIVEFAFRPFSIVSLVDMK